MSLEHVQGPQAGPAATTPTMGEIIDRLSRFDGPPEQFLAALLAVQCSLSGADDGAILRVNPSGEVEVVAVHPPLRPQATAPVWLAQSVESAARVVQGGQTGIVPLHSDHALYGERARHHVILVPLRGGGGVRGAAAFLISTGDRTVLATRRESLELSSSLLSLYEMRLTLQRRQLDLRRLRVAMETLAATNDQQRFTAAAMAICNELAARFQCDHVGLGVLKGRYVKLKGLSHTEKFSRKMKIVQDIEAAMEECLDQDVEIVYPAAEEATYINRATGELSARHGPTAVLSLPLRRGGEAVGVLTLERPIDRPFGVEEIESLRLTSDLATAGLLNLHEQDRWFGAKLAGAARKGLAALIGPKHTWAKGLALAVIAAVLLLTFAQGNYHAEAPFVVQAIERRVVPAPFDGYLAAVSVVPGQAVHAGQELARLSTEDLRLERASLQAERAVYRQQAHAAMAKALQDERKRAEAQIARLQAERISAKIELLDYRIQQAKLVAPIDGKVIGSDLKRQIDMKIATGDVLFEVAPAKNLRAELSVPEDQIADVRRRMEGELATAMHPGRRVRFIVERINPVAEVSGDRNVFKVRVRLLGRHDWMLPGMEGSARVRIGRRSYGWLWTRRLVNWLRMKLWV